MEALTAAGLATLAGVTEAEIGRMTDLGILVARDGPAPFRVGDLQKLRLALACERAGLPMDGPGGPGLRRGPAAGRPGRERGLPGPVRGAGAGLGPWPARGHGEGLGPRRPVRPPGRPGPDGYLPPPAGAALE